MDSLDSPVLWLGFAAHSTPQTDAYDFLTNSTEEVVNFNPEPVTGMIGDGTGGVWAVTPYDSVVVHHTAATIAALAGGSGAPVVPSVTIRTGLNPASLALWSDSAADKLLGECSGTHALFVHDAATGDVEKVIMLETTESNGGGLVSEGADIAVSMGLGAAFVSCPDASALLKIDLGAMAVVHTTFIDVGRRPEPLALDAGVAGGPTDDRVYVAMTVTCTGSTGARKGEIQPNLVRPAENTLPNAATPVSLPDDDVWLIDGATGVAQSYAKGVDSLAPNERMVVRLKVDDALSFPEIASRAALPIGTVKTRYYRGLRARRVRLGYVGASRARSFGTVRAGVQRRIPFDG